jgi:hypothetical protein
VTDFTKVVAAGTDLSITVRSFDEFDNPTSHPEDSFSYVLTDDPAEIPTPFESLGDGTFSLSMPFTTAVSYLPRVIHSPTLAEVRASPLAVDVLASSPDAASSTHNVDFKTFVSRKTGTTSLELVARPIDRFNNTLPTATGYAVAINGDDPLPLLPPSFSHTHVIPKWYSSSLLLSFTYNGIDIANSPVTVNIQPDYTLIYMAIAGAILLVFAVVFTLVMQRRASQEMELEAEMKLTPDEALVKQCNSKVKAQRGWLGFELFDAASDILVSLEGAKAGERRERKEDAPSAAGAGHRSGCRGETPRTPPAAGEIAHALGRTRAPQLNLPSCSLRSRSCRTPSSPWSRPRARCTSWCPWSRWASRARTPAGTRSTRAARWRQSTRRFATATGS